MKVRSPKGEALQIYLPPLYHDIMSLVCTEKLIQLPAAEAKTGLPNPKAPVIRKPR